MTTSRPRREWIILMAAALLLATSGCSSSEEPSPSDPSSGVYDAPSSPAASDSGGPAVTTVPMGGSQGPVAGAPAAGQQEVGQVAARRMALEQRQQEIAADYLRLGERYLEEGRYQQARQALASALEVQPGNAEAQRLFDRVSGILGDDPLAARSEMRDAWDFKRATWQQASFMARQHFDQGRHFFTEGDYAAAVEEYQKALLILQANPTIDADFDEATVKQALAKAREARDQSEREAEAARLRDIEKINAEREADDQRRLELKVQRLWEDALVLFEREKFEECESVCAQIIDLEFGHPEARSLKEAARRARHEKATATNISEYRREWQRALQEVKEIGMPITGDPIFPDLEKWRKISARGPVRISPDQVAVSEVDEEVRRRLEGTILPSVDWSDKTLGDAIRFIRNNTGVDIIVTRAVDEMMPPEERILRLSLDEIRAYSALKLAVEYLGLRFRIQDGLVKITTPEALRQDKAVEFYEVRDLTARLNNFPGVEINLNPSGYGAGLGGFDDFGGDDEEENIPIEVDRLIEMIRQTVDPVSWDEDPANTIVDKNGTLVVRQTPENHRSIRKLLADLRKSTGVLVQIESRFISVENNFLQDIGVDWRGLGDDSGGVGVPGKGTSVTFDDFGPPGSPLIIGTSNDAGAWYQDSNADIRARTENLFDQALGNPDVLTASGGFSMQWSYLDDTELEAILRATQKYERVNTVTAPTLLVYNTQRANLQVTNHVAYVKDFDVEIAQASVIADPIVDVVREGVVLDVRPIVSNDRRFVTLELRPTVATLMRPIRTFSTTLAVGTAVTFEVPELRKESLKTTVVMPDGGTLLLGGLKYYEEQDLVSGVPVLKDIPILSFFFSRKGKYTNLRDLIILLRVKIMIMEEFEPTGGVAR